MTQPTSSASPATTQQSDEPFGRQPQPVRVRLEGVSIDVAYWLGELMRRAEFKGDMTIKNSDKEFVIYPRAVND